MRKLVALFSCAVMIVMFQNCAQNVNFKTEEGLGLSSNSSGSAADDANTGDSSQQGEDSSAPGAVSDKESSEQFKVSFNSESAPLDMIWVIDNSGSMGAEAALVRKNFDAFLTTLNKSTNFRLLLISQQGTSSTGVSIPSSFDITTHKQINQKVDSTNGTTLLLDQLKLLPAGFLRDDSKKIIVFVTDDNSKISSSSFLSSLTTQQKWSAKDVSVSSFIGLDAKSSPCMDKEGVVYKDLAAQTSGRNYNICSEDWSSHFADLINVSVAKAVRRFTINAEAVKSIVEVKVDGVILSANAYSLSAKTLTLADSISLADNSMVSIRYK